MRKVPIPPCFELWTINDMYYWILFWGTYNHSDLWFWGMFEFFFRVFLNRENRGTVTYECKRLGKVGGER